MAPITTILLALVVAVLPATVTASKATTWSGSSCNSGDVVNWTGHAEKCRKLGNVKSLKIHSIDPGCSITYYSDSSCSKDATAAKPGACYGFNGGRGVGSWSWDC